MKTYTTMENKAECKNLVTFERNRYFYGKLLTVDDFQTEQDYFRKQNKVLNRTLQGSGIVAGLEISNIKIVEAGMELTITEGYALDECGNLIVVEHTQTHTLSHSLNESTLYLYIQYQECDKDRVASISESSSCEESCCYNRISEVFKLTLDNQAPQSSDTMGVLISVLEKTETAYSTNTNTCQYLLSNQQLMDELALHTNNSDNPHQVSAEQVGAIKSINHIQNAGGNISLSSDGSIEIESDDESNSINLKVSETVLSELHADIIQIKTNLDSVLRFLMDKALKYKLKAFTKVLEHFESKSAIEIVKTVQEAIDKRVYINQEEFLTLMVYLTELESQLIEEVSEVALEEQLELYRIAIKGLQSSMGEKDIFAIAVAQDEVCERAEWLVPMVQKIKVPKITTLTIDKAISILARKGLLIGEITPTVSPKPTNSVLSQDPSANTEVEKGSYVSVSIAIKSDQVLVPSLIKLNILNAKKNITRAGLKVGQITQKISNTATVGTVLSQEPKAGTKVNPASLVNLSVAKAQERTNVPLLIKQNQKNAKTILGKSKLNLGTVTNQISRLPVGTILSQSPKAGTNVLINSEVSIIVATARRMTTVPNLVGFGAKDEKKVQALIEKAKLQQGNVRFKSSNKRNGTILSQSPEAGTKVSIGTAINITIAKNRLIDNRDPIIITPIDPILVTPISPVRPTIPVTPVGPVINPEPFINPFIAVRRDR